MAPTGIKEEKLVIDYGFSISAGNIIESSTNMEHRYSSYGSETSPPIMNTVKRKTPGPSNKTRKNLTTQTRTVVKMTSLTDDCYGWRKYGQKTIHNESHPKSYYRCTHHTEEKCEAKKWVQMESDNPPIYKATYLGQHTCKNPLKIPQLFLPLYSSLDSYPSSSSSSSSDHSMIESFDHYSSSSSKPMVLRFDQPHSSPCSSNNIEQVGVMNQSSSSSSIPTDDSMMFSANDYQVPDENDPYCCLPSIPSPNCNIGSYDFDTMLEDYLLDFDNVNFMEE